VIGVHAFEQFHGEAAAGDVDGLAGNDAAVAKRHSHGRSEVDAHMLASLAGFARHGDADAEDDDVELVQRALVMMVPGWVPSHSPPSKGMCRKRGITIRSPQTLKASSTMKGCAMRASKKVWVTMPPLLVTLNLPAFGLKRAIRVGSRM